MLYPGEILGKERVNCGLFGTINITTSNNINIDEYAVDNKNIDYTFRLVKS